MASDQDQHFYGIHVVESILQQVNCQKDDILYIADYGNNFRIQKIIKKAQRSHVEVVKKTYSELNHLASTKKHQGIVLCRKTNFTPKSLSEKEVFQKGKFQLYVVIDRLNDPQNLGSIIRSLVGLGASGLVLPKNNVPTLNATVAKCSAGVLSTVKVLYVSGIPNFLEKAKKHGVFIIGTDLEGDDISKSSLEYIYEQKNSIILLVGSEDKGIKPLSKRYCDLCLRIPMTSAIQSLNVANATSIFLYLLLYQK